MVIDSGSRFTRPERLIEIHMIPGEKFIKDGEIELNGGRKT